jgi:hypothetical protein
MNRSIQALRGEKLIRTLHRTIFVDDWDQLAATAEFDPAFLLIPTESEKLRSDRMRRPRALAVQRPAIAEAASVD